MNVLRRLCLGDIESEASMPGVGAVTLERLLVKGWIKRAHDDTYDVTGWKITPDGEEAYNAGYDAGC
jgi:hypothetical protein